MNYLNPQWPAPQNVHAYTTTRIGGYSTGNYESFNLAHHVNDKSEHVLKNRQKLINDLKLPAEPYWLEQTHSTRVVKAMATDNNADAAYTTKTKQVCSILTADCLPILVCDKQGSCVAAVHAGWRGLLSGIIENSLQALAIKPENLLVWLGPAIGPKAFEVGDDVRQPFIDKNPMHENAFYPALQPGKWFADIYKLATNVCHGLDITQLYGGSYCTYTDKQRFFSFRRDGQTGRMAHLIWLS